MALAVGSALLMMCSRDYYSLLSWTSALFSADELWLYVIWDCLKHRSECQRGCRNEPVSPADSTLQRLYQVITVEVSELVWDCFQSNLYRIYWDFSSVSLCVCHFLGVLNTSPCLGGSAKPSYAHAQLWRVPINICVVFHWLWYWSCKEKLLAWALCLFVVVFPGWSLSTFLTFFSFNGVSQRVTWERKWGRRNESLAHPATLWRHPESVLHLFGAQCKFETSKHYSSRNLPSQSSWGHLFCLKWNPPVEIEQHWKVHWVTFRRECLGCSSACADWCCFGVCWWLQMVSAPDLCTGCEKPQSLVF